MADMYHFEKISYVFSGVHVTLDLSRFGTQFTEAQWFLGNQVLQDCKPYMPHRTGTFIQLSHVEDGGRKVVFPGPAARMLYGGLVMVDAETGKGPMKIEESPGSYILRYREGAKLIPSDRKLTYSSPTAVDHWYDTAFANHGQVWIQETKRIGGGG